MLWSYEKFQKIRVARGLGQVRIKTFLVHTIQGIIFGTKFSNPVKLDKKKKIGYLFLRVF